MTIKLSTLKQVLKGNVLVIAVLGKLTPDQLEYYRAQCMAGHLPRQALRMVLRRSRLDRLFDLGTV